MTFVVSVLSMNPCQACPDNFSIAKNVDVYRVGRLNFVNSVHDHMLRVLEIDTEVLNLTNGHGRGIVPEGAPPIDALVVCYDSSDSSSFEEVEVVLRKHCDSVYPHTH